MNFLPHGIHVSHAGLPSQLETRQDWKDYIEDVEKEIAALQQAWREFKAAHAPSDADEMRYESSADRLEELRAEAIRQWRAMRGSETGLTG